MLPTLGALKQVHGNKPQCIKEIQDKYYAGCKSSSKFTGDADDLAGDHDTDATSDDNGAAGGVAYGGTA